MPDILLSVGWGVRKMTKSGWIGLDVGGTGIKAGLVVDGEVLFERSLKTGVSSDKAILEQLLSLSSELINDAGKMYSVAGIGVAVPGTIDAQQGVAIAAANLPWNQTPICAFLSERTGLAAFLENDTNAAAVGEATFGAGKGVSDFFYMAIGTGVGGGVIAGGKLLVGGRSQDAGEVGHIVVDPRGPRCRCGQVGCLEAVAAAPAIARRGEAAGRNAGSGILWEMVNSGEEIDAKAVFMADRQGDTAAARVIDEIGEYLAVGLIAVRRLLAPDLAVIGGGVAAGGERLLAAIERGIRLFGGRPLAIRLAALKQPGVVGAAAVAMSRMSGGVESCDRMPSSASYR